MADVHGAPSESMMVPARDPSSASAPLEDLSGPFDASTAASGAGVLYPQSDRQAQAERLLSSPPGYSDFTILGGSSPGWPVDVMPSADPDNGGYGGA